MTKPETKETTRTRSIEVDETYTTTSVTCDCAATTCRSHIDFEPSSTRTGMVEFTVHPNFGTTTEFYLTYENAAAFADAIHAICAPALETVEQAFRTVPEAGSADLYHEEHGR